MNGKVKKILKRLLSCQFVNLPVEASITRKILKKGLQSLEPVEVDYFDNFILPEIKKNKLECRFCGINVGEMGADDFRNFILISHCIRCAKAKKIVRIMRHRPPEKQRPENHVSKLFDRL